MSNFNNPFQQQYNNQRSSQKNNGEEQRYHQHQQPYHAHPAHFNGYGYPAQYYQNIQPHPIHPYAGHGMPPMGYYPWNQMNQPQPTQNYGNYQQKNTQNTVNQLKQTPKKQKKEDYSEDEEENNSIDQSDSESEEEQIYYKRKTIIKKKDPILDSRQEIKKWVEARKRNYPRRNKEESEMQVKNQKTQKEQMSLLEKKIRKKLVLINGDSKSVIKKQKDLDILRKFILYPRKPKKAYVKYDRVEGQPLIEEITPKKDIQVEENANQIQIKNEGNEDDSKERQAVEVPIKQLSSQKAKQIHEKQIHLGDSPQKGRKEPLSVDVIIKHLQMKQQEDSKTLQNFMDYKSNSFQYRYQHQTLQTNLLLDNVFKDTSRMLQAIRYIVKNNFFE